MALTIHDGFRFLLATLAAWRVTCLIAKEDGPWDFVRKLRITHLVAEPEPEWARVPRVDAAEGFWIPPGCTQEFLVRFHAYLWDVAASSTHSVDVRSFL